ncbi:MAG TPA: gfo/Idh/MocA family oxidoreductase, partial [Candidatus Marinimicrobia bacterium]|nr:gfo/Idh/MocA family oxidoreductase [Candidatus Neomarinimicrobiota bacterium]
VAKDYVRKLRLFERDIYITIDFLLGLTEVYKVLDADIEDPEALLSAPLERNGNNRQIVYEKPKQEKVNALQMELTNFVEAIEGKSEPIVSGEDGREALRLALLIQEKIEKDL